MSLAHNQKTCAICGKELKDTDQITIEPLIDPSVRYVVLHWNESTFSYRKPMPEDNDNKCPTCGGSGRITNGSDWFDCPGPGPHN